MYNQNDIEFLKDMMHQNKMTAEEANVEMVRMRRVLVVSKLPAAVRRYFNSAVKTGKLAHMKKKGMLPEVYYHPTFKHLAIEVRNQNAEKTINAIKSVCI